MIQRCDDAGDASFSQRSIRGFLNGPQEHAPTPEDA
jgi:hypothetical protein